MALGYHDAGPGFVDTSLVNKYFQERFGKMGNYQS